MLGCDFFLICDYQTCGISTTGVNHAKFDRTVVPRIASGTLQGTNLRVNVVCAHNICEQITLGAVRPTIGAMAPMIPVQCSPDVESSRRRKASRRGAAGPGQPRPEGRA